MAATRIAFPLVALLTASLAVAPACANATRPFFPSETLDSSVVDIGDDRGGFVADYALRMFDFMTSRKRVRFVGSCASACTLYLALPSSQTCVEAGASFRFHAPLAPTQRAAQAVKAFMMREYPRWVQTWIQEQGGLTDRLVTMDYSYVSQHVKRCA